MRIAIIGSNGQLGFELAAQAAEAGHDVERFDRARLDVTTFTKVSAALADANFDVVYNCTAYNAVDLAESEEDDAIALNATAVAAIASACQRAGSRLFHYSTDYVFGNGHQTPINESEAPAPLSAYGRSKRLGEELALLNNPGKTVVMRTTGLYSGRRKNFVSTMVALARKGTPLKVVDDQKISPTWVRPLADVSLNLIDVPFSGILHAVSHGGCTWHDLAKKAFELEGIDADLSPTTAEEWGAAAPRPEYSVLDNALLRTLGLDTFVPWDEMLERFLSDQSLRA